MRLIDADKIVEVAEHAYGEWNSEKKEGKTHDSI